MLRGLDYSLQSSRKTEEDANHPDRDAQLHHINAAVKQAMADRCPAISVDTKKKELIGNYHNSGKQWRLAKEPRKVQGHDFPSPAVPHAYPYGIYDIRRNAGFVNIGTDHNTGAFAVASIRGWWRQEGRHLYPTAQNAVDYETILYLISHTSTAKGLRLICHLDRRKYATGARSPQRR